MNEDRQRAVKSRRSFLKTSLANSALIANSSVLAGFVNAPGVVGAAPNAPGTTQPTTGGFTYSATLSSSVGVGNTTEVTISDTWTNGPGTGQYKVKYLKAGDTPGTPTGDTGWIDVACTTATGRAAPGTFVKTLYDCIGSVSVQGQVKPPPKPPV